MDTNIEALSFAGRDAQVFWAAFADANEAEGHTDQNDTTLLVGADATRDAVRRALAALVTRATQNFYDVVAIHFSCHCTEEGGLLLADARSEDEAGTALPIAEITATFRDLKAGSVVVVFDSCFSGLAAGPTQSGDKESLRAVMDALADGDNRAVVWATGADGRAYESPRLRHGALTYALVVEGLYGTLGARDGGIDIARWLNDAVQSAEAHAARDGRYQRPGRITRWTATPTMPRYSPGPRRLKQLQEEEIHAVSADLGGLEKYGLSEAIVSAVRARLASGRAGEDGPRLTDLQLRSIAPCGALAGRSLLVSGPTSSGKTLVGELASLAAAARRLKTAVLLPMRSLAAEKWEEFSSSYSSLGLRAVRSYGGAADDDDLILRGHFDVGFFTYEKFWFLALTNPRLLDTLGLVVIDEAHMIADKGRGHVVELVITLLRLRQQDDRPVQIIALSAALGDTRGFPEWLGAAQVIESTRPIPLREGVVGPTGQAYVRDSRSPDARESVTLLPAVPLGRETNSARARGKVAAALVRETLREGEQTLVFRATRSATRTLALSLARTLELGPCEVALRQLGPESAEHDDSRASRELRQCLENGVGFHISDLERAEREVVEAAFRSGALRVLVATSGLAMGVNLPANTVIIGDNTRGWGEISVAEYRNMAGRAGRWMGDITFGSSFLIAANDVAVDELWRHYVIGEAEPLDSQLSAMKPEDLALVLMVLKPGPVSAFDLGIRAAATFGGHQRRDSDSARWIMETALSEGLERLVELGLARTVEAASADSPSQATESREPSVAVEARFNLTNLGLVCGRDGLRAESAARVLRGAELIRCAEEPLNEIALVTLAQVTCELDQLYTPSEKSELAQWDEQSQLTLGSQPTLLRVLRQDADDKRYLERLKRLNGITLWVRGRRLDEIEDAFSMYSPDGGSQRTDPLSGAIRAAAERTADVLRAVGKLVAIKYPEFQASIRETVVAVAPRLQHGVVREATALMRLGLGIRRGAALQFIAAGIATPEAFFEAIERDDPKLYPILTSEGVYRIRASVHSRLPRVASPNGVTEARTAAERHLFDLVGDATAF